MVTIRCHCFLLFLFVPLLAVGQESVLRLKPYDGSAGSFLNAQISADTTANRGIPANRVYLLQRGGAYLANATFRVNTGQTLRMRANDSAGTRPVIYLYPTGSGTNPANPPGNFIDLRGDLVFKNLILTGYFEPIDTNLNNLQGGLLNVPTAGAGAKITIDSCIITNSNGNHIRTDGAVKLVKVTNSVFANMGYLGRSNLGAGKGIDLRDASADTVIFEHCTFVNWQDRVIRHYNFSNPLAGTGPIHYLRFNQNTLVNGMSYHGLLSLGSMGKRALITNNLMIDPFSLGNDTDAVRQAEFLNHGERDQFGGSRIVWVFTAPNDTTRWTISNNYYAISDSGQKFFSDYAAAGVTGEGSPLTWHLNRRLGADSVNAFKKISLKLNNIPAVMSKMNRWYRSPSGGNKSKNTPSAAWNKSFDFDRRGWLYFDDTLDCTYPTSSAAYSGAIGGYPVGDLNWFPARKAQWLVDPRTSVEKPGGTVVPTSFTLQQNYPNPFNPSTKIVYTLPQEAKVRLEIFDLLGRKIATLVDESRFAGEHAVEFDASGLTSGVYVYRLSSSHQVLSKKMTLVR
ncbi:MAG TPA: hypothetical protein DCP63_11140 [Bacteroidetes bacterium]|nr:hypothetical protein [Bacteroidota bacterium]